jgi:hypothetical protein
VKVSFLPGNSGLCSQSNPSVSAVNAETHSISAIFMTDSCEANDASSTCRTKLFATLYTTVTYYHPWVIDPQETAVLNIRSVIDTPVAHVYVD